MTKRTTTLLAFFAALLVPLLWYCAERVAEVQP